MARAGDVIESPVLGDRIVFRKTAAETGGEFLELDDFASPGNVPPVEHLHARQEETLEVVDGEMLARVGGKERIYRPGEVLVVPPGTPHTWRNAGDTPLQVRTRFRPAGQWERFFETVFGLARDGKTDESGAPPFLQLMAWVREYELFVPRPPPVIQRALAVVLRPVARLRGYRAWYAKYSPDAPAN